MTAMTRAFTALFVFVVVFGLAPRQAAADGGLTAWPRDRVYVENRAGTLWPVRRAAETLDDHSPLDLVVVSRCPRNSQCIRITSGNVPGRYVGATWLWVSGRDITRADIELEPRWGRRVSYRMRTLAVCHELGHAVGLGHVGRRTSCMYPVAERGSAQPDSQDYRRMRRMY